MTELINLCAKNFLTLYSSYNLLHTFIFQSEYLYNLANQLRPLYQKPQEEWEKEIISYAQLGQKKEEQDLSENLSFIYPDSDFLKKNMKKLSHEWRNNYIEYSGDVDPLQHEKISIFTHYDSNKKIADYVIYWCKSLLEWDCAVIFISTCETLSQDEIDKIKPYVSKIIVRPNQGYDFGGYCIGFDQVKQYSHHEHVIFMNDSVVGPLSELNLLNEHLPNEQEFLGMTENPDIAYHLQSYFFMFHKSAQNILNEFFDQFVFINNKVHIIFKYEIGFSQFLIKQGYKAKAFCSADQISKGVDIFVCPLVKKYYANQEFKEPFRSMFSISEQGTIWLYDQRKDI